MTSKNEVTPRPSHPIRAPKRDPIKMSTTIDEINDITIKIKRV